MDTTSDERLLLDVVRMCRMEGGSSTMAYRLGRVKQLTCMIPESAGASQALVNACLWMVAFNPLIKTDRDLRDESLRLHENGERVIDFMKPWETFRGTDMRYIANEFKRDREAWIHGLVASIMVTIGDHIVSRDIREECIDQFDLIPATLKAFIEERLQVKRFPKGRLLTQKLLVK